MKKIIIVSHGGFASGLKEAAIMIAGNAELYEHVSLAKGADIVSFKSEFESLLESLPKESELLVLADLLGGSPYTTALQTLEEKGRLENTPVIAGASLALLLELSMLNAFSKETIDNSLKKAAESVKLFCHTKADDTADDTDDDLL